MREVLVTNEALAGPAGRRRGGVGAAWRRAGAITLALLLAVAAAGSAVGGSPGAVRLISRAQLPTDTAGGDFPAVSADGRYVAFHSVGANLVPGQVDAGASLDVFLHDRVTGTTLLVSRSATSPVTAGSGGSFSAVLSADGRFVVFESTAPDLVPGQVAGAVDLAVSFRLDVFLFDRETKTTTLVSRTAASPVTTGNGPSSRPALSADGRFVAFLSDATDLVPGQDDTNGAGDVFLYDRLAGTTTLVSGRGASATVTGSGSAPFVTISADGGFVAFVSGAPDLAPGQVDTNNADDVFLHDRAAGTLTLVSRADGTTATAANGTSIDPRLSADGAVLAFVSSANNLVPSQDDTNFSFDVFLFDRVAGANTLVSRADGTTATAGGNGSGLPALSADGAFVAFVSRAKDLVPLQVDADFTPDVFLYARGTGAMTLVSRMAGSSGTAANGGSEAPGISFDGGRVMFLSEATDLVTGLEDANDAPDVFVHDRVAGTTRLVTRAPASPLVTGAGGAFAPVLAADGGFVAFASLAGDLVDGVADLDGAPDIFLHRLASGQTTLVSRRDPARPGDAAGSRLIQPGAVSADGRHVVFVSDAANLVPGQVDGNASSDVFLHDRETGTTVLVSRAAASPLTAGNRESDSPVISADGRFVAFRSRATDLVAGQIDANGVEDVFLYDRLTGTTTLVSRTAASPVTAGSGRSDGARLSADGAFVAFRSTATDLVPLQVDDPDTDDVFLHDRALGTTVLVSRTPASPVTAADDRSDSPVLSVDGRFVAFRSSAGDLVAGQSDVNLAGDVFLYDRQAAGVSLVSRTPGSAVTTGDAESDSPEISADGRFVAFRSRATNLVPLQADAPATDDVFLHDRELETTTLVSRSAASAVAAGNGESRNPVLSADGGVVAFRSLATDLVAGQVDGNGDTDLFLFDRLAGTTALLSRTAASALAAGNDESSLRPALSGDGRFVAFLSLATDLVAGQVDGNGADDVFLYDRVAGRTTLVSRRLAGPGRAGRAAAARQIAGNGQAGGVDLSADGAVVVFGSQASDLTADADENGFLDLFAWERPCAGRPCRLPGSRPPP